MADTLDSLGKLIGPDEKRDAIHIAVEPVVAAYTLNPGDHVGFIDVEKRIVGISDTPLGIVDPFIVGPVRKGQRFWLFVYPRKITSLRHVWSHPRFPEETSEEDDKKVKQVIGALEGASKRALQDFAHSIGTTYEELISHAREFVQTGDYWSEGGKFESVYIPPDFWHHYQGVTGEEVPLKDQENFFSCSC